MRHNVTMKIKQCLLFIFLALCSQISSAESWYQVEIVVFERLNPAFDGELWRPADIVPRTNLVELIPQEDTGGEQVPFSILPAAKNRLAGTNRAFKLSGGYRPLIHYSWQQPALERRSSKFVHVQRLAESSELNNQPVAAEVIETDEEPAFIEDIIQPESIIDGSIRVRSGFYLHVDVDLTYFASVPQHYRMMPAVEEVNAIDAPDSIPVNLKSSRKVKLNEIHYFDHPMFGLIIQVSRLQ